MTKIGSDIDSIHFPVIVLVHTEELGRGSVYADHFVLVRGMTSDMKTVYLNDADLRTPEMLKGVGAGSNWINGGPIALDASSFKQALAHAHQRQPGGPYAIMITK
jgi:hypothetical protein